MGSIDGFIKYNRELPRPRDPKVRVGDYNEIYEPFPEAKTQKQAARCMDCGIPFCHKGCPLGNIIPDFNDAVYGEQWEEAISILSSTNNFPEFTGRVCPAPCEASCVLGINKPPVAIEHIEKTIAEKAFELDYIKPNPPAERTGKTVAVIGSGPSGLAAADQLNKAGHTVTVFERSDAIGGLLRYGIPDFKMEKWVIDRRLKVMEDEGVVFKTNADVGNNVEADQLKEGFDAIIVCTGSTLPRNLPIPGRDLEGVLYAMEFLTDQNKKVAIGEPAKTDYSAKDKHVVVIGGGDTGSDCIGTSHRQGAKSVMQIELLKKPALERGLQDPWPNWPMTLRTSSSHEEGGERGWSILTKKFVGNDKGEVKEIELVDIEWYEEDGRKKFKEKPETLRKVPCNMALLAIGFLSTESPLLEKLGVESTEKGTIAAKNYRTSVENIFTAGDARRGQSLVVWAIAEGREAALQADKFLQGATSLEARDHSFLEVRK